MTDATASTDNRELHVVFGTGPLGLWTGRELARMGKRVRMVNRRGQAGGAPAGAEVVKGDAYDRASTTALTKGATAVYQCAQPEYHQWPEKFPALQEAVIEGAAANGANVVLGDNLYMYGDPQGRPLTEETPYAPHTRKGRVRAQMAEAAMVAHRGGKVRVAVGRASDFFGPDDPRYLEFMFLPALTGKRVNLLGRLDQPHTWSYAPDFGKALAILGTRDEALGQVWHIPSPPPVTGAELVALLAEEAGRAVKPLMGNAPTLRVMGLFNPPMRELVEMLYEWNKPFVMDSGKFERAFGVQPTPLREAVRETMAWARSRQPASVAAAR